MATSETLTAKDKDPLFAYSGDHPHEIKMCERLGSSLDFMPIKTVHICLSAMMKIDMHVESRNVTKHKIMFGKLLGKYDIISNEITVFDIMPLTQVQTTASSIDQSFELQTFIHRKMCKSYDVIGWYHTHDLPLVQNNLFFSPKDVETQALHQCQSQRWRAFVGVVVDIQRLESANRGGGRSYRESTLESRQSCGISTAMEGKKGMLCNPLQYSRIH